MPTYLEKLTDGVYLYVWEGEVTLDDIRDSMLPELHSARKVVFDMSGLEHYPFNLSEAGTIGHRHLSSLEHVFIVPRRLQKVWAEKLVRSTLQTVLYSFHKTREEAIHRAIRYERT